MFIAKNGKANYMKNNACLKNNLLGISLSEIDYLPGLKIQSSGLFFVSFASNGILSVNPLLHLYRLYPAMAALKAFW